ncbi:hypothetical protein GOODEAATRI_019484 [Goodea atripinnis]|uniref:Uncharacterized protein n=1 Tax=Goodea atripinnis TaxID=208336 RepID=A0ABV0NVY0_9TELE
MALHSISESGLVSVSILVIVSSKQISFLSYCCLQYISEKARLMWLCFINTVKSVLVTSTLGDPKFKEDIIAYSLTIPLHSVHLRLPVQDRLLSSAEILG